MDNSSAAQKPATDNAVEGAASRSISDRERSVLNALDPSAATSTAPWELEITSKRLTIIGYVIAAIVLAIHIFMAIVVGIGFSGVEITTLDQFSFVGIGIILAVLTVLGFSRPRVRVNREGVEVRNFIGTRFYNWVTIYGLNFPRTSRIARLELPDFEYVPLWALQSMDRQKAIKNVERFRALEAQYMPQD